MKKLISAAFIGFSVFASAQISLAGKANVLIPTSSASWKNLKTAATNAVEQKGKNITGFNVFDEMSAIAFMVVAEENMIQVRDALKPHRGEIYVES